MKRLVLFLGITVAISTITWALKAQTKPEEKRYKVELTLNEWQHVMSAMEMAKNALKRSDIPSRDVIFINDSLFTNIQNSFANQITSQIQAEQKKATQPKDSTSTKTKKN